MFLGLTALEFATLYGVLLESLVEIPADTPIPGVSPLLSTLQLLLLLRLLLLLLLLLLSHCEAFLFGCRAVVICVRRYEDPRDQRPVIRPRDTSGTRHVDPRDALRLRHGTWLDHKGKCKDVVVALMELEQMLILPPTPLPCCRGTRPCRLIVMRARQTVTMTDACRCQPCVGLCVAEDVHWLAGLRRRRCAGACQECFTPNEGRTVVHNRKRAHPGRRAQVHVLDCLPCVSTLRTGSSAVKCVCGTTFHVSDRCVPLDAAVAQLHSVHQFLPLGSVLGGHHRQAHG
jgi:hypothetical protein